MTARAATAADWAAITDLRHRVFVLEQGVPVEIEQDDADALAVHAVALDPAGRVVATGRLLERDDLAVIGRMAVDRTVRGGGYGAAVLDELHWQAVLRGLPTVELHAQLSARGFYGRAGYTGLGQEYEEAGIRHLTMRRPLPVLADDPAGRRWELTEADGAPLVRVVGGAVAHGAGHPWAVRLFTLAQSDLRVGGASRHPDVGPSA